MKSDLLHAELARKENNGQSIANDLLASPGLISDLISHLSASNGPVRYKCAKILRIISESRPELLYPYFDLFDNLLGSNSNIIRWNAIDIVANLAAADSDHKFDKCCPKYYKLLDEGSLITAAHVVENSGKIALAKPQLRGKIFDEIMRVTDIPLPTAECRNIIAGKTIATISRYPELIADRKRAIAFVRGQLNSARNATRQKAEACIKNLGAV